LGEFVERSTPFGTPQVATCRRSRQLEGILVLLTLLLYDVDDSNRFSSTYRFRFSRRDRARGFGRPRRRVLGWVGLVVFVAVLAGAS
jgi:hypothetical protein